MGRRASASAGGLVADIIGPFFSRNPLFWSFSRLAAHIVTILAGVVSHFINCIGVSFVRPTLSNLALSFKCTRVTKFLEKNFPCHIVGILGCVWQGRLRN